jgi:hypothetical protein
MPWPNKNLPQVAEMNFLHMRDADGRSFQYNEVPECTFLRVAGRFKYPEPRFSNERMIRKNTL